MTEALDDDTLAFAHRVFDLAREGGTAELAPLIDAGLPPNLTNDKGDTLLLLAAYAPSPPTVRALLERGAHPDAVNERGQTPVAAAAFRSSAEAVEALLAAGADPYLGSPDAVAPAQCFDLPDMVRLLTRSDR